MQKQTIFTKLLREPLLHFLLIGVGLFFLFSQLNTNEEKQDREKIIIAKSKIDALTTAFLRERGRAPVADEIQNLLENDIRQEVLYREALMMGLDKDDAIIRRRLSLKMLYLFEDLAVFDEPSDEVLQVFLEAHPAKFTIPAILSFYQVYLDPKEHPDKLREDAQTLLRILNHTNIKEAIELGDRSLLSYAFSKRRESDVLKLFGDTFAQRLFEAKTDSWQGPFESAYGKHFVYIYEKSEAYFPLLEQIKERVLQEYKRVKQHENNEVFYKSVRDRYEINIDDEVRKDANVSMTQQ